VQKSDKTLNPLLHKNTEIMKKEDIQALCNNLEDALYGRTYIGILSK